MSLAAVGCTSTDLEHGRVLVEAAESQAGRSVCRLTLDPIEVVAGDATLQAMGIGNVYTHPDHRGRGLARRVLDAALAEGRSRGAAACMLYGIDGMYDRLGFESAGDEHRIDVDLAGGPTSGMLDGDWQVRPFASADLPAVAAVYGEATAGRTGAAVRPLDGRTWERLLAGLDACSGVLDPLDVADPGAADPRAVAQWTGEQCRVLVDPHGHIGGYVWLGAGCAVADAMRRDHPDAFVAAEIVGASSAAADAAVAAAIAWAREAQEALDQPLRAVRTAAQPGSLTARAAARHNSAATRVARPRGGSMVLLLDAGRLPRSLRCSSTGALAAALRAGDQFMLLGDRY